MSFSKKQMRESIFLKKGHIGHQIKLLIYLGDKMLWYLAQILPLPHAVAAKATSLAGSFLWLGHMERLAWQELHGKKEAGGLGLSCISMRGEALLAKQFCHQIAVGGTPAGHLAFWLGVRLATWPPPLLEAVMPLPCQGPRPAWRRSWKKSSPSALSRPATLRRLRQPASTGPLWTLPPPPQD